MKREKQQKKIYTILSQVKISKISCLVGSPANESDSTPQKSIAVVDIVSTHSNVATTKENEMDMEKKKKKESREMSRLQSIDSPVEFLSCYSITFQTRKKEGSIIRNVHRFVQLVALYRLHR